MSRNTLKLALAALCSTALFACLPGTDPSTDNQMLQLNRLGDGNLEYCDDATGECVTLPYNGSCQVIEITIDLTTGQSCQRCINADGTAVDQGCADTSVQCVMVTIPDPDCVVCAYVNGAVIYSTCTVNDDPECESDWDCMSADGSVGYCQDGVCIYEPGCRDDSECPAGFVCMFYFDGGMSSSDQNGDGSSDMPFYGETGTCVPVETDVCSGVICPDGTHCEVMGGDTCAQPDPATGERFAPCYEPYPECVPDFGCATDADCMFDDGTAGKCVNGACVFDQVDCDTRNVMCMMPIQACPAGQVISVIGACYGPCVDPRMCLPMECRDDLACPGGFACELTDCNGGSSGAEFAPCLAGGVCVPVYTPPTCDDVVCAEGEHCELQVVECFAYPCDPIPVCVADVVQLDCNPINALCDMIPPTCPAGTVITVVNGCYGECVTPDQCLPMYCGWDADCPAGFECSLDGATNCPAGANCLVAGFCMPIADGCFRTGCSGQICSDVDVITTCEYRSEYACYDTAICARQADGACGWTETEQLRVCLDGGANTLPCGLTACPEWIDCMPALPPEAECLCSDATIATMAQVCPNTGYTF